MANLTTSELERLLGWLSRDYERAVSKLTVRQQECVVLIFVEEYTEEEVADRLGIDQRTVAWHKREALQKLKEMF